MALDTANSVPGRIETIHSLSLNFATLNSNLAPIPHATSNSNSVAIPQFYYTTTRAGITRTDAYPQINGITFPDNPPTTARTTYNDSQGTFNSTWEHSSFTVRPVGYQLRWHGGNEYSVDENDVGRSTHFNLSGTNISGTYQLINSGRPGEKAMLLIGNISISGSITATGVELQGTLSEMQPSISSSASWAGTSDRYYFSGQPPIRYEFYSRLMLTAYNLPDVIPVTPETPSPAPNPVLPMPSVPPVVVSPPPAPTPPPPTEDMAVPPAPVVPRPVAVADTTPGLAPNVPVIIRDFIGSPTMPLTRPKPVPNPYSGSGSSASSSSGSSAAPRSAPTPVPV